MVDFLSLSVKGNQTLTVYSGVKEYGTAVASFTANNTIPGQPLPSVSIPLNSFTEYDCVCLCIYVCAHASMHMFGSPKRISQLVKF